jgi:hypothetical protein
MRLRATAAALLLLAPGPALAATPELNRSGSPAECARLNRQIDHFEAMAERAEKLENELWTERMQQHVDLLRDKQKERCPDDADSNAAREAWLAFVSVLKTAGKVALTYFTFGAF